MTADFAVGQHVHLFPESLLERIEILLEVVHMSFR